jgi:hypothetical protein
MNQIRATQCPTAMGSRNRFAGDKVSGHRHKDCESYLKAKARSRDINRFN